MHKMTTELAKMNRKKIALKNELTFDMGEQMCYNRLYRSKNRYKYSMFGSRI